MRNIHIYALTAGASIDNILGLSCQTCKELSPKRYAQSRHCFADSYQLEQITGLYATPIVYCMCGVCVQRLCEIISIKSSKLAIHKNLDP